MAELAIKGHPTRGGEVIKLLEMLGGVNKHQIDAIRQNYVYFIDTDNIIRLLQINQLLPEKDIVYSLEEFEEKYPYKVGDNVTHHVGKLLETHTIIGMRWDSDKCRILYYLDNCDVIDGEDILYSVECKTEQSKQKRIKDMDLKNYGTATIKYIQENGSRDMELIIPYNQEIVNIDGRYILRDKKPQYPTTYEECCKVLGYSGNYNMALTTDIDCKLFNALYQIKVCRDAWWKMSDDWKPDWNNQDDCYHAIKTCKNEVCLVSTLYLEDCILAFPTEEMRDAFHENFKGLIEQCKELL